MDMEENAYGRTSPPEGSEVWDSIGHISYNIYIPELACVSKRRCDVLGVSAAVLDHWIGALFNWATAHEGGLVAALLQLANETVYHHL
jgi:hypothetical protein